MNSLHEIKEYFRKRALLELSEPTWKVPVSGHLAVGDRLYY